LTKAIQDARLARDNDGIKAALKEYDDALERYVPVLMAMARIYWDRENYPAVEKLFRQSAEFCSEHEVWKLNVAHVFFMQVREAASPFDRYATAAIAAAGVAVLCSSRTLTFHSVYITALA
jgi:hypothetical protein